VLSGLEASAELGTADGMAAEEGARPGAGEQVTRLAAAEQDAQHNARPRAISAAPATRRLRKLVVFATGQPFRPARRGLPAARQCPHDTQLGDG
jgi:hypothetical protein